MMGQIPANLWAGSILAGKTERTPTGVNVHSHHGAVMFEAGSYDEALGKAWRMALKLYPKAAGWERHDVVVSHALVTVETVVIAGSAS
jgi:hypothetical protein